MNLGDRFGMLPSVLDKAVVAANPVEVRGLSKTYRVGFLLNKQVRALQALDLTIAPGQVYGLLGPNGAGKSTTIKLLMGLVKPSGGTAKLFGKATGDVRARQLVGFLPENPCPYAYLTGREFVTLAGRLVGLSGKELSRKVEETLALVEMGKTAKLQIRRYSKGMVQRVALAQALIGSPKLLVLDEPTSGLDPLGRRQLRDIIIAERDKGTTVLFCTHIIPDVEALCDRVAVLVSGKLVKEGSVQELVSANTHTVELVVEGLSEEQLRGLGRAVEAVTRLESRLIVRCPEATGQALLGEVLKAGGRVRSFQGVRTSLEDFFMSALKQSGGSVGAELS